MRYKLILTLLWMIYIHKCYATDLLHVYQQSFNSDPVIQQAISNNLAVKEGKAISIGNVLPQAVLKFSPSASRDSFSGGTGALLSPFGGSSTIFVDGSSTSLPPNITQRSFTLNLKISQVIFDYAKFVTIAQEDALSKSSRAALNEAFQAHILRVVTAYFAILKDTEIQKVNSAEVKALKRELYQVHQKYKENMATERELADAQTAYDNAVLEMMTSETTLINDNDNLYQLTGEYYNSLAKLNNDIPLISPEPKDVSEWVSMALKYNWSIKANQYKLSAARNGIHREVAGHLPTVNIEGFYFRHYSDTINRYPNSGISSGPGSETARVAAISFETPLLLGGTVIARTRRAVFNYNEKQKHLEQVVRETVVITRKNYYSLLLAINQIETYKHSIKSARISLENIMSRYREGKETLATVLMQRRNLYQAKMQYQNARISYITNYLSLKKATGTLCPSDVAAINAWLYEA